MDFIDLSAQQEIIKDKEPQKTPVTQQKRQKVDGIVATVGDYIVLDSDIDKAFLEIESSVKINSGLLMKYSTFFLSLKYTQAYSCWQKILLEYKKTI